MRTGRPKFHQVERWFGLIIQRAIKRGSDTRVQELIKRIEHFIQGHNENPVPCKWTATADSLFEKLSRLSKRICGTGTRA
jgi:putative transposase